MEQTNNMSIYQRIMGIRTFLKGCQQLSWDINATEKRYPLDKMPEDQLLALLDIYEDLRERFISLAVGINDGEPL